MQLQYHAIAGSKRKVVIRQLWESLHHQWCYNICKRVGGELLLRSGDWLLLLSPWEKIKNVVLRNTTRSSSALIWEWTQNRAFTVYIIYRKKSAHKSNSELLFPPVKLGFHLSLLTITERYLYSVQSKMKSHFSVKSSVMNNVMDNVKLLKWMLLARSHTVKHNIIFKEGSK